MDNPFRVGVWDIECSSLRSNTGVIISSDIKLVGGGHITRVNKNLGGKNGLDDKELCIQIKKDLESLNMVVSFFGLGYDLRFINSRLLYWGEQPVKKLLHVDVYRIARRYFATTRRNLDTVAKTLGIVGKNHVDLELWLEAGVNGNKKAIGYIVEHNILDTEVTEKVFLRLAPLIQSISIA